MVLDRLPNDALQDVLLKYWHNNHEYKFSKQDSEANKDINNTYSKMTVVHSPMRVNMRKEIMITSTTMKTITITTTVQSMPTRKWMGT